MNIRCVEVIVCDVACSHRASVTLKDMNGTNTTNLHRRDISFLHF